MLSRVCKFTMQVITAVVYVLSDDTSNMSYYTSGFQEETTFLRESVSYVDLNRYNRANLYMFDIMLDPYRS